MRKRRNSLSNDSQALIDDAELQERVLLPGGMRSISEYLIGESLLWSNTQPMPKNFFATICATLSLCAFLVVMMTVTISYAPAFKTEITAFFAIPAAFMLFTTVLSVKLAQ